MTAGGVWFIDQDSARPERMAAAYLAVLAYFDKPAQALEFRRALICDYLRQRAVADPGGFGQAPQAIEPIWLTRDPKKDARTVDVGIRRLVTSRLPAAEIAAGLLVNSIGEPAGWRATVDGRPAKITALAKQMAEKITNEAPIDWHGRSDIGTMTPENALSRIWSASKPVLHLAVPFRGVCLSAGTGESSTRNAPTEDVDFLGLMAGGWVQGALAYAAILREQMQSFANSGRGEKVSLLDVRLRRQLQ